MCKPHGGGRARSPWGQPAWPPAWLRVCATPTPPHVFARPLGATARASLPPVPAAPGDTPGRGQSFQNLPWWPAPRPPSDGPPPRFGGGGQLQPLMCVTTEPGKLELTPGGAGAAGKAQGTDRASPSSVLPLTATRAAGAGARPGGGWRRGRGRRLLLSTDQLRRRQAGVTCDSQCQFHARGNRFGKSGAGFTCDKKSAALVFAERPIAEGDRCPRLPAASRPVWSLSGPRAAYFRRAPPPPPASRAVKINCQSLFTAVHAANTEDFRLNCQLTEFKIERRNGPRCFYCPF